MSATKDVTKRVSELRRQAEERHREEERVRHNGDDKHRRLHALRKLHSDGVARGGYSGASGSILRNAKGLAAVRERDDVDFETTERQYDELGRHHSSSAKRGRRDYANASAESDNAFRGFATYVDSSEDEQVRKYKPARQSELRRLRTPSPDRRASTKIAGGSVDVAQLLHRARASDALLQEQLDRNIDVRSRLPRLEEVKRAALSRNSYTTPRARRDADAESDSDANGHSTRKGRSSKKVASARRSKP